MKGKKIMPNKKILSMNVPTVGQSNLLQFDPNTAIEQKCKACDCKIFTKSFVIKRISRLANGNKTDKDINLEIPVYHCRICGEELKMEK